MKKYIIILILIIASCGFSSAQSTRNNRNAQQSTQQQQAAKPSTRREQQAKSRADRAAAKEQQKLEESVQTKPEKKKYSRRGRVNKWINIAEDAFRTERYFKAFGYYDRAFRRTPEGDVRMQLRERLGETQRRLNNPIESVVYFGRVWDNGNREKEFLMSYADVLLKTADYQKSEMVYKMLLKLDTTDVFIQNRILSCELGQAYSDTLNVIFKDQIQPQYRLSTPFSKYGMVIVDGKLIYSSAQRVEPPATDYRTGHGFSHIYTATLRPDSLLWENPIPLSFNIWGDAINDGVFTYDPVNQVGYFQRCNEGNCGIYSTSLQNGNWTIPERFDVNGIGATNTVGQPAISPDGKHLIFVSRAPGGEGGSDLWMTTKIDRPQTAAARRRAAAANANQSTTKLGTSSKIGRAATKQTEKSNAAPASPVAKNSKSSKKDEKPPQPNADWTIPVNLGKAVNSVGDEVFPIWINSEAIAFSSNGRVGYGGLDIYVALADSTGKFIDLKHVEAPINSSFDDYTLVIDPEIPHIFFSSSRYLGFEHSDEIYSFPKTASIMEFNFKVIDSITQEPLANSSISICGKDTCAVINTDSSGNAKFLRPKTSDVYDLAFAKSGYTPEEMQLPINKALDIIPMRDIHRIEVALLPSDIEEPLPFDSIPATWDFLAENLTDDTLDVVAAATLDTLAKLFGPDNNCVKKLTIKLDPSPNYTQIGDLQAISKPRSRFDTIDSCDIRYYEDEAFFTLPVVAETPDTFTITGTITYAVERPDSTFEFKDVPFAIPAKGAPKPLDTTPLMAESEPDSVPPIAKSEPEEIDSVPPIAWYYSVNQPEDSPEDAELIAKAVIKPGYELISDKPQNKPFDSIQFRFDPDPEKYDLNGPVTADRLPLARNTQPEGADTPIPVSYYNDTVIFKQPIKIKDPNDDFRVTGEMDYTLGKDDEYSFYPNVPLTFPIKGKEPEATEPEDTMPAIIWYYSVDQEKGDTTADLLAKAIIRPDVILVSDDQLLDEFLSPILFSFIPDSEKYEPIGKPKANKKPLSIVNPLKPGDTLLSAPISYFKDSVTFVQKIKVKSPDDFFVNGTMDYSLGLDNPLGLIADKFGLGSRFNPENDFAFFPSVPLSFLILGTTIDEVAQIDEDLSWADGLEEIDNPVFTYKAPISNDCDSVNLLFECMKPGMTAEDIIECMNQKRRDCESVDLRAVDNYKDRINDPNRRANMAVLPKSTKCKDCDKTPQRQNVKQPLFVEAGDDKKVLKLTDNGGYVTYFDLAPNTKYEINVTNYVSEDMANLPSHIKKSDIIKTVSTKDYVIYECMPKLAEVGDEIYVNNVYYDFDKSEVIKDGYRELDRMIIIAIKNPQLKFELTSHADERGSVPYNIALTERRLNTVVEYIRKKGLDMSRLITKAVGKSDPLIKQSTNEDEHALNRRTTIRLYDPNATNQLKSQNYEVPENSPLDKKGLWFRVQVDAFKKAPEFPLYYFKDILNAVPECKLSYYMDRDGLYKFTVCEFSSLDQARKLNQKILDINKESYVVAFIDGQRITIHEAQMLLKKMQKK